MTRREHALEIRDLLAIFEQLARSRARAALRGVRVRGDRDTEPRCELRGAADMIAVMMREQHEREANLREHAVEDRLLVGVRRTGIDRDPGPESGPTRYTLVCAAGGSVGVRSASTRIPGR